MEAEAWRKTGCWLAPHAHIQCSFLHHPGPHALPYQPSMRKMFPETCPLVRTTCRGGLDLSISIINEENAPADLPTGQCGGIFSIEVPLSLTTHLSLCQVVKKLSITQLQFYLCLKVTPEQKGFFCDMLVWLSTQMETSESNNRPGKHGHQVRISQF